MWHDRNAALEFDAAFSKLVRFTQAFEVPRQIKKGILRKAYVMFIFETDPKADHHEDPRYSKRGNAAEINCIIRSGLAGFAESEHIDLLFAFLIRSLRRLAEFLDKNSVKHEISELVKRMIEAYGKSDIEANIARLGAADETTPVKQKTLRYQLVIQFKTKDLQEAKLFELEDELGVALAGKAEVDGNDVGMGSFNIFILTEEPRDTFELARPVLEQAGVMTRAAAAFSAIGEDNYVRLWPPEEAGGFEL
jgi:hypothetical protein